MNYQTGRRLRKVEEWGLVIVCVLGLASFTSLRLLLEPTAATVRQPTKVIGPYTINIDNLWRRTNGARLQAKLKPLSLNPVLNTSSAAKCADMVSKNYWAQNDPAGTPPWHFITDAGITYKQAGENIAQGFITDAGVFKGLTDTDAHKANMLNPAFTQVGFAVCKSPNLQGKGPKLLVVQQFTN